MISLIPQPPEEGTITHDFTEEVVAPLDAYITAKPNEPTFTLQGGDPLAPPIVRFWAYLARIRAGIISGMVPEHKAVEEAIDAAIIDTVASDERERDNLLVRATAAEEVSWAMDEYRKHGHATEKPTEAEDTHLTELQRIELHDLKVRVAQRLSNFKCELIEMRDALSAAGYDDSNTFNGIFIAGQQLKMLNEAIEPRRIFKS